MIDAHFDLAETDRLLSTTRVARRRLDIDRPVDRAVILECIGLAQQAPTGSNDQGWRWFIDTDPALRSEIADLHREAGRDYLQAAATTAEDPQIGRVYECALALTEILAQVPVHAIPCIERRFDGAHKRHRRLGRRIDPPAARVASSPNTSAQPSPDGE